MKKLHLFLFLLTPSEKVRHLKGGENILFLSKISIRFIKRVFRPIRNVFLRTPKGTIRYVREGGVGNGSSWTNASNNLQLMISISEHGDQVWVAEGTYFSPVKSFRMKNGVAIYGGFPNLGEPVMKDRNWMSYETILSGGNQRQVICNHFNQGNPLLPSAILDGFTVTEGKSTVFGSGGGGIYNNYASPTITNVTISDNKANKGGGIFNDSYSSPILVNVIISGNIANNGSDIYNLYCSSPILTDCYYK